MARARGTPLSRTATTKVPWGCPAIFFSIFLVVGLAVFWLVFLRPLGRIVAARGWEKRDCTILSSEVGVSSSSDGDTYRVKVRFSYVYDGKLFESDRYDFFGVSSSGRAGKQAAVDRLPPGTETSCWVDPGNPSEAVLDREPGLFLLFSLLPLAFVAVGGGGLVMAFVMGRRRSGGGSRAAPLATPAPPGGLAVGDAPAPDPWGPVALEPTDTPAKTLGCILLVTLFWNGIVSVFVAVLVHEWMEGRKAYVPILFLLPFVLIGLFLIWKTLEAARALLNPVPALTLTPGAVRLGARAVVSWRFTGRTGRLQQLRIVLTGREEATYRRGTDSVTDRSVFSSIPVVLTADPFGVVEGSADVVVPADSVSTFGAEHNKIAWTLDLIGETLREPRVETKFPVVVLPLAPERGGA